MSDAQPVIVVDTDQVRVTTWTFSGTGAATGQHRHEFDYIVVPVTGGSFVATGLDGSVREMTQTPGVPYLGTQGTAHDVASAVDQRAVFVEIDLKR
jgi:hypothetical protein